MEQKVLKSKEVLKKANNRFDNIAVLWTGGKDSTTALYLVTQVLGFDVPAVFVDTGVHFEETIEQINSVSEEWGIEVIKQKSGAEVKPSEPMWCCQMNKTLPLHGAIRENGFDAVVSAIRWDECDARSDEEYFSPRDYSDSSLLGYCHTRIHPLLHWTLEDIWNYIEEEDLPIHPLYKQGYNSIGCEPCTEPCSGDSERGGRKQDKENMMENLRDWK